MSTNSDNCLTSKTLLLLLEKFHKNLENLPFEAIKTYQKMADFLKNSQNITILEDCAEHLANYIKRASVWKARLLGEGLQPLPLPSRLLIIKHFSDFSAPGLSIDNLLSTQEIQLFGRDISVFRKSKMDQKALVFGANDYGKLGSCPNLAPEITELKPLDFEFNEAYHGENHTIYWRRFTGEVWASGKLLNFLKQKVEDFEGYSCTPVKLDFINLSDKKELPDIKIDKDFTVFENFTPEKSLFIGHPVKKAKFIKTKNLEIWEQGPNWMVFTRKWDLFGSEFWRTRVHLEYADKIVKVYCENGIWKCDELKVNGTMINYFCGKRVPKMRDLRICEDGSIWYLDKETLYKGSLHLSDHSQHGLQLIASLLEVPFPYRIGGFSVATSGRSGIIYPNLKNHHVEELHPRHQMDYSTFTMLTYDPWCTYFSDITTAIDKLDSTENWLKTKLPDCFNEYGFINDELETLTAINHLYQLIKIQPERGLPEMMISLLGWETDKLAQLLITQDYQKRILEQENLRIQVAPEPEENLMERVIEEAQNQYHHMISVIREGLEVIQSLQYPSDHEGIWTYVKYIEFIGYYRNRSLGSKGRFETKQNIPAYFQTRELERIVKRRVEQGNLDNEEAVLGQLVKVQAIGHRSDKTKMNNFYIYPCIHYAFRTFIEAMDPRLLEHIDERNFLDLNLVCHNDPDNTRFISYIRDLTGCDNPRDFGTYQSRISLDSFSSSFTENYIIKTSDLTLNVPKIIFKIFCAENFQENWDLERISIPQITGAQLKLAIEALLDIRELLRLDAQEVVIRGDKRDVKVFLKKYEVYQLYCNLRFMEAAADVIKLIVMTGQEIDIPVFRKMFRSHQLEMTENIARFRPEILFLWDEFPVPKPQLQFLEKISQIILSKRYHKLENQKPLIMSQEPMFGIKMGEEWLKSFFTNGEEDGERDVKRKIWRYIEEDNDVRDFSKA